MNENEVDSNKPALGALREPLGANTPWNFRGFCHLYIGGEAIAVGVMPPLQPITALAVATVVQYS